MEDREEKVELDWERGELPELFRDTPVRGVSVVGGGGGSGSDDEGGSGEVLMGGTG